MGWHLRMSGSHPPSACAYEDEARLSRWGTSSRQSATPKLELAVNFIPGRSDGSLFLVIMPLLVIAVCTATDLASEQPDTVMCKGLQAMNAHACNFFKAVPLSYVPACFGSVLGCS